jgi:catechol 2,3-dioxygenase-like lactoylglutathione lyase family enzyme
MKLLRAATLTVADLDRSIALYRDWLDHRLIEHGALDEALAASWGFMLPAGTGPNALAWSTGHIAMPRVLRAGLLLDLAGVALIVCVVWGMAAMLRGGL